MPSVTVHLQWTHFNKPSSMSKLLMESLIQVHFLHLYTLLTYSLSVPSSQRIWRRCKDCQRKNCQISKPSIRWFSILKRRQAQYRWTVDDKRGAVCWRIKSARGAGWVYTLNGRLYSIMKPHNHDSDIAYWEAKEALSMNTNRTSHNNQHSAVVI